MNSALNYIIVDLLQSGTAYNEQVVVEAQKTSTEQQMLWVAFYLIKHNEVYSLADLVRDHIGGLADTVLLYALYHGLTGDPEQGIDAMRALSGSRSDDGTVLLYEVFLLTAQRRDARAAKRLALYLHKVGADRSMIEVLDRSFRKAPLRERLEGHVTVKPGDSKAVYLF